MIPGCLVTGSKYAIWYRASWPVSYANPVDPVDLDFIQTYTNVSIKSGVENFSDSEGRLVVGPKLYRGETAILLYINQFANSLVLTPRGLGWSISFNDLQVVTA